MTRSKYLSAASLALLFFLAACGSGGLGDIYGGGNGNNNYDIRGTVDYVDQNTHSVYLTNVTGTRSMLSNGGNSVRVYYDDRTPVTYNGQNYRPEDLERGDEVSVRVDESGSNTLTAESVTVLRDVSSGTSSTNPYPSSSTNIRGTVRYVDTSRRTIEVDRGNGSLTTVNYDTNTPVYYSNNTYRASDLERGDEIDIRVDSRGYATQIDVLRSVSSNGTYGGSTSSNYQTVRGTVRYVDTSRRTIELDSTSWRSGFNPSNGSSGRIVVSYDTNTNVDVSGKLYPVSGLEVGDIVDVQVQNANASTPFAQRILLVRDVNNRY